MKVIYVVVAVCMCFFSCTTKHKQAGSLDTELIRVDFGKEYKDRKFPNTNYKMTLQKLEDNPENPIGYIDKLIVYEDRIYILDAYKARSLFIYSMDGKFLNVINRTGKGPGEFNKPNDFDLDKNSNNIVIMDISQKKFIFYSLDGVFLKELKYGNFLITGFIMDGDEILMDNAGVPFDRDANYLRRVDFNGKLLGEFFPFEPSTVGIPLYPTVTLQNCDNTIYYLSAMSNTIYSVDGDRYQPACRLDFGKDWAPEEFCRKIQKMHPVQMRDMMMDNNYICFLNYVQTKDILHLNFSRGKNEKYSFYYNRITKQSILFRMDDDDDYSFPIATYNDEFIAVKYRENGAPYLIFHTVNFDLVK